MGRLERRILKLNEEIARQRRELELVAEELRYHSHLNDDARRDAAVSDSPFDRADARATGADVARFERSQRSILERIGKLEAKRDALIERL